MFVILNDLLASPCETWRAGVKDPLGALSSPPHQGDAGGTSPLSIFCGKIVDRDIPSKTNLKESPMGKQVFIFGAGSSVHAGCPLNRELIGRIVNNKDNQKK